MRSVLATILVIVVVVAGYLLIKGRNPAPSSNTASTTNNLPSNTGTDNSSNTTTSSVTTYNNVTYGITFNYPSNFIMNDKFESDNASVWRNNASSTGVRIVEVKAPDKYLPGTNFSEAWFTVGNSNNSVDVSTCLKPNYETAAGTASINNVVYSKFTSSDAAAGNRYDTTSYRTLRNGKCYAIEYTIHYANIGNYDPSMNIKEFDENAVKATLENIVETFRFTK